MPVTDRARGTIEIKNYSTNPRRWEETEKMCVDQAPVFRPTCDLSLFIVSACIHKHGHTPRTQLAILSIFPPLPHGTGAHDVEIPSSFY